MEAITTLEKTEKQVEHKESQEKARENVSKNKRAYDDWEKSYKKKREDGLGFYSFEAVDSYYHITSSLMNTEQSEEAEKIIGDEYGPIHKVGIAVAVEYEDPKTGEKMFHIGIDALNNNFLSSASKIRGIRLDDAVMDHEKTMRQAMRGEMPTNVTAKKSHRMAFLITEEGMQFFSPDLLEDEKQSVNKALSEMFDTKLIIDEAIVSKVVKLDHFAELSIKDREYLSILGHTDEYISRFLGWKRRLFTYEKEDQISNFLGYRGTNIAERLSTIQNEINQASGILRAWERGLSFEEEPENLLKGTREYIDLVMDPKNEFLVQKYYGEEGREIFLQNCKEIKKLLTPEGEIDLKGYYRILRSTKDRLTQKQMDIFLGISKDTDRVMQISETFERGNPDIISTIDLDIAGLAPEGFLS